MKKKISVGSVLVILLILLAPVASVVASNVLKSNIEKRSLISPLFTVRAQRSLYRESTEKISVNYLGKEKQLNIFPSRKSQNEDMINKAIKIFGTNPALLNRLLDSLDKFPYLAGLLTKYGVNTLDIKNYMRIIKNNPLLLTEEMNDIQISLPHDDSPQPLGLSTSNPLQCFIVILVALVPITVVLTLLVLLFTVRIFTCMNVNDCANNIAKEIWDQLLQGLTPG